MDFDLFKTIYDENISSKTTESNMEGETTCQHTNILLENNNRICENCGILINKDVCYEKDWRFYGNSDTKHTQDPSRCHFRKTDEISIFKDVDKLRCSEKIVLYANQLYEEVTQKKIFRGNSRKGIIFACIFHAYKIDGNPMSCESLISIFNIDRKVALKGLKHVNWNASKESIFRNYQISLENIIIEIMDKFYATDEHKTQVLNLYQEIKDRSALLNRSRPQSMAAGLVRYFIINSGKNVPMNVFKSKVNLSELTINRIVKEITRLVEKINLEISQGKDKNELSV